MGEWTNEKTMINWIDDKQMNDWLNYLINKEINEWIKDWMHKSMYQWWMNKKRVNKNCMNEINKQTIEWMNE